MRIAYFHNWSSLGSAVADALLDASRDEMLLIAPPVDDAKIDHDLVAHASRRGMVCAVAQDGVASDAFHDDLVRFRPDILVVGTFPALLPGRVLAVAPRGAFNVHPSLLPAYRGALPEFWVIRNGEPRTGVTIHRMVERADAGGVVAQAAVPLHGDETFGSLLGKLAAAAPPLVLDCVARLRAGEPLRAEPQDERAASRAPLPRADDLAIRWESSARSIECLVRACDEYFDAVTSFRGERVVLRATRPAPHRPSLAPGAIDFDPIRKTLDVGTGDGCLRIDQIELEGRRLDGVAFGAEAGPEPGERFTRG